MAATPDRSLGFFSAVCSRLRAASSAWRRNDAETQLGQEATVRSRQARRAGAARRIGRNLAFVSFNLEVLLFVYAFWRARKRNFNWRQPLQLLPMLVIPALATLIYAAFIRFTRALDLKDKKTLQHQNDSAQRGSGSHHNEQNGDKKCDPEDDASSFSSESDPGETSELGKHHRPSINLRDDGGGDGSWGHSKDFQPMHSDGLRRRIFSIEKTHITNSTAFRQLIDWSSEHLSDDPEDPNHMEGTAAEHHSNSGADIAENGAACSTAQISSLLHGCSIAHIMSNAMDHADFSSSMSCPKSNGGLGKEDAVQTALAGPKDLPAIAQLHHEGLENESSKLHVSDDNRMPFISEEELLVSSDAIENIEHHSGSLGSTLCSQEGEKEDVVGGFCFVKISPELSLLSSPEFVVEGGKDASEKESCELDKNEEDDVAVNPEEEALLGMPLVNTAEPDYGTSGLSLCAQDSNTMEDFLDPLVFDSFEDSFAAIEFLSHGAEAKMTEVLGVVDEGLSEGASNHQNDIVASSYDGGDTENTISDSVSVQLIPEANIMEALQDGQETLSDRLQCTSLRSGIFLSSSEISNDEAYSSSNSNSYTLYANSVENEELLASKGRGSGSKDEVNFAFLDTSILLNDVTSAESWMDSTGCSQCIPESNRTQSLHDVKQALPRIFERANFGIEESLIFLDQEINLEIFSLYSRSSSCVSEVNVTETLRSATFPALENDNDFNFDERTSMMVPNLKHAENYTSNAMSYEFIPEINMTETLNVDKEATACLEHEVSSNFDISLDPPDVGNGIEKTDSLDLMLWSFDPVVDASEGLQAAQGFSKLQSENDFTFVKANVIPKEVNDDRVYVTDTIVDLQNSKEISIDARGSAQPGLSKSQDEGVLTLRGTCMFPDGIINAENVLTANCALDLHSAVGSHFFSQNASPGAQPQESLMFKESLDDSDVVYGSENNSDSAKLLMSSTEANLIESLDGDQRGTDQQQEETNLVSEDMYMVCQGSTYESCLNNLGYQHISDANMTKTLQGADRLSSKMFHDDIFCTAGTAVSLDAGNDPDNSSANSGSEMHTAQNNTVVLLGLQGPEKAMVSISQHEVDSAEENGSHSIRTEVTGAAQGVNKSPSQSQDEFPGTYVSTDKANHPEYLRSSSSMLDNLIDLAAGHERSFDPKDENPSSFEETSPSENLSNNLMCALHTSKKESVTFSVKGFPDPSLEDIDSFDKVSGDEQANEPLKENALNCELIARTRAEVDCTESHDFTEASNHNCTEASESVNKVFFETEHQGPELVVSQLGTAFFIDVGEETEKYLGSSSTACALETLEVPPVSAVNEKGFLEGNKVCEWRCTDEEPKDLKVKNVKDDVEDLIENHEKSP